MGEFVNSKRFAAILCKHTFTDFRLGFGGIKGVCAGFTGYGEQESNCCRNHGRLQQQATMLSLIGGDGLHGENHTGSYRIADSLANCKKHQHKRQLT